MSYEPAASAATCPVAVIQPRAGWIAINMRELVEYRELLYFFIWRDVKVRYKQTVLGAAWAILQPLITMIVFSIFFGRLAGMGSDGVPYPLFSYAALVPWSFFATGLSQSSNSLLSGANLLRKVYFPRLVLPIASVLAGTIDLAVAFAVLVALMFWYGFAISSAVLVIPALLVLAIITSLGAGLWLSALNVQFRDVRYVIPFLVQIWLLATPIAYSSSLVPDRWRPLYGLNPMVGVVEGFRWALLGTNTPPGFMILASSMAAVVMLMTGVFVFRRMERTFADVV